MFKPHGNGYFYLLDFGDHIKIGRTIELIRRMNGILSDKGISLDLDNCFCWSMSNSTATGLENGLKTKYKNFIFDAGTFPKETFHPKAKELIISDVIKFCELFNMEYKKQCIGDYLYLKEGAKTYSKYTIKNPKKGESN